MVAVFDRFFICLSARTRRPTLAVEPDGLAIACAPYAADRQQHDWTAFDRDARASRHDRLRKLCRARHCPPHEGAQIPTAHCPLPDWHSGMVASVSVYERGVLRGWLRALVEVLMLMCCVVVWNSGVVASVTVYDGLASIWVCCAVASCQCVVRGPQTALDLALSAAHALLSLSASTSLALPMAAVP